MSKTITSQYLNLAWGLKKKILDINNRHVKNERDKLLLNLHKFKEEKSLINMENTLSNEELVFKKCETLEKSIKTIENQIDSLNSIATTISNKFLKNKGKTKELVSNIKVLFNKS